MSTNRAINVGSVTIEYVGPIVAGENFIIRVGVDFISALFDKDSKAMVDSNDKLLIPEGGLHKSNYSGSEIDNFISEVLT